MKRLGMVVALMAGLTLAASHVWAQEEGETTPKPRRQRRKAPAKKRVRLPGQAAAMVKVCNLTEEQQKKLAEIHAAGQKAMKQWQEANAEKLKAAQDKMKAAREAKDREAMKKASEEMKALQGERAALGKKTQDQMLAVLTDEQRAAWQLHNDVRAVTGRLRRAKLTDEQMAKVKELVANHMKGVDRTDKKAVAEAMKKIQKAVHDDILTDEQREAVKVVPSPRARKPRPAPPTE